MIPRDSIEFLASDITPSHHDGAAPIRAEHTDALGAADLENICDDEDDEDEDDDAEGETEHVDANEDHRETTLPTRTSSHK